MVRAHPIEGYQALCDSAPPASRVPPPPEGPKGTKLELGRGAHLGNTILNLPYRRCVSTDRLNREDSHLAAYIEGGSRRPIFCDLDGVLVDFDKGVRRVMGTSPDQLKRSDMWRGLAKAKKFYAKLDWMPDGRELWNGIVDLHPTILTGLPMGNWAEPQKREWCKKELGGDVFVITCMSRDKHIYCQYDGSVLIDDRLSLKADWESAGGVFIHHTSAKCSLRELRALLESSS